MKPLESKNEDELDKIFNYFKMYEDKELGSMTDVRIPRFRLEEAKRQIQELIAKARIESEIHAYAISITTMGMHPSKKAKNNLQNNIERNHSMLKALQTKGESNGR